MDQVRMKYEKLKSLRRAIEITGCRIRTKRVGAYILLRKPGVSSELRA